MSVYGFGIPVFSGLRLANSRSMKGKTTSFIGMLSRLMLFSGVYRMRFNSAVPMDSIEFIAQRYCGDPVSVLLVSEVPMFY